MGENRIVVGRLVLNNTVGQQHQMVARMYFLSTRPMNMWLPVTAVEITRSILSVNKKGGLNASFFNQK